MTLEEALNALDKAKRKQYEHECSNDMYYSSQQYQEDKGEIEHWELKIRELRKSVKI